MSNDPKHNFEFEQGFIPHPQFAEDVRATFDAAYEIVQAYFSKKDSQLTRAIHFDMEKPKAASAGVAPKPVKAYVDFSVAHKKKLVVTSDDPIQVAALYHAWQDTESRKHLIEDARLRCQRQRGTRAVQVYLALKLPKVDGGGGEFEFEIPGPFRLAALQLMHDYGKDHIVKKTRYVKQMELDGRPRLLELDRFEGRYDNEAYVRERFHGQFKAGEVYKLEIEHNDREAFIGEAVWKDFASAEVTDDKHWRSRQLAGHDTVALQDLENTMRKLEERKEAEARLRAVSGAEEAREPGAAAHTTLASGSVSPYR
jgi:CYTH domain-containing protein